ncbi:hypothetical protein H5410_060805 [Solanum commersonii]|uniref:Craniofacial development protein 2-like n=1 Tax=Solanum commersonii TaxID=4109 RepID=A0A9J5W6R9_SOLCO|nr:hypothetical protein H5410_060805 [Solanum commersonii]
MSWLSRKRKVGVSGFTGSHNLRVGSWNIGSLMGKFIELVKILKKRKINIACVQETRWRDTNRKIVIGGDFNGHIGAISNGFDDVHGGFGFGERNGGGTSLLDFAKVFELVIANSCFPKKENHLVTFRSSVAKTQIDYFLLRKGDRGLCKVIPSENLTTQHKLLVMDLEIKRARRKKIASRSARD